MCLGEGRNFIADHQGICSYFLLMDADHIFKNDKPTSSILADLTEDAYSIQERSYHHVYWMNRIVKASTPFEYAGAVHEYLRHSLHTQYSVAELSGVYFIHSPNWHIGNEKWLRDVNALEKALDENPEDRRSHFYLGNTYSALGRFDDAIYHWKERIMLGGWREEVFMSAYYIAQAMEKVFWQKRSLNASTIDFLSSWLSFMANDSQPNVASVVEAYAASSLILPYRREPIYDIGRLYRTYLNDFENCYQYSKMALSLSDSSRHTLFMAADIYLFRVEEQICICAYYTKRYCEGMKNCKATVEILTGRGYSDTSHAYLVARNRAASNMAYYYNVLTTEGGLSNCD